MPLTTALQRSQQIDIFGNIAPPVARSPMPSAPSSYVKPQKFIYAGINIYINPTRIFCQPTFAGGSYIRSMAQRATEANLENNRHAGTLSAKAKNKIRTAVNWLALAAKKKRVYHAASRKVYQFKLNFITLTLPDTAEEITEADFKSKLLQPWLAYARKYYALNNYVWRLEFQENGKIHVHIVSDTFIHYTDLRRSWNRLLDRNGWLEDFAAKFGHKHPPTEQVKAVKSVRDIAAYCAKYVSKTEKEAGIFAGRLWGCNYELSRAQHVSTWAAPTCEGEVLQSLMCGSIENKKMLGKLKPNGFHQILGESFYLKGWHWLKQISGPIRQAFDETIHYLRTGLRDEGPIQIPIQYQ